MNSHSSLQLGVNVDHIATLRQARGVDYPDPLLAAQIAQQAGADGITVHLREDRRHIQEHDVRRIHAEVASPLNLEMAATPAMLDFALEIVPHEVCLVPESRQELTTEGGLEVASQVETLKPYVARLREAGIRVSMFIDPVEEQITASHEIQADIIELHTGTYADSANALQQDHLQRLQSAASFASQLGLQVNAGHGLHYQNVGPIAAIRELVCLNIGHSIVARACISGLHEAVFTMKQEMNKFRLEAEQAD